MNNNRKVVGFVLEFDRLYLTLKCFWNGRKDSKIIVRKWSELPDVRIDELKPHIDQPLFITVEEKTKKILKVEDASVKIKVADYFPTRKLKDIFKYNSLKAQVS